LLALGALVILVRSGPALAAPAAQDQRPVIAQPEQDGTVRGVVQLVGTATHPDFQRYELYYTPWPIAGDNAWIFIGPDAHYQQQPLGLLGTWDSRAVPDGAYALRVRVVKKDGNYYDSDPRRVVVANVKAPDNTPTPTATNAPAGTPTDEPTMEPTATVLVQLPGQNTATPTAPVTATVKATSGTPRPTATSILSADDTGGGSSTGSIGQAISVGRFGDVARRSAFYTIAAFAAIGLFFAFKGMLVWLWHRIRP
jgi:hypothetical protein